MSYKVYDYKCSNCEHVEIDVFVRSPDADSHACENCGKLSHRLPASPQLDYLGMGNDPDMHTAYEKKGDMITQRHIDAGQ